MSGFSTPPQAPRAEDFTHSVLSYLANGLKDATTAHDDDSGRGGDDWNEYLQCLSPGGLPSEIMNEAEAEAEVVVNAMRMDTTDAGLLETPSDAEASTNESGKRPGSDRLYSLCSHAQVENDRARIPVIESVNVRNACNVCDLT